MKKTIAAVLISVISMSVHAQQNGVNDKRKIFADILQTGNDAQKDSLKNAMVADAQKATIEEELQLYYNFLNGMKFAAEASAVEKRAIKLFPKGRVARQKDISKYYDLTSLKEKEKLYNTILKKYPPTSFPEDGIVYDYVTAALAKELVKEGDKTKGLKYLDNMKEEFWRAQGYIPVATELLKQGDTTAAVPLIQKSIADALKFIRSDVQDNKAKFAGVGYPGYIQIYSDVLAAKGQYKEALALIEEAKTIVPKSRAADFRPAYAKALAAVGRDLEAFYEYALLYQEGQFSYEPIIGTLYSKLNNSNTGYATFLQGQQDILKDNINEHLQKIVVSKDAPSFKLKNLKGELVDLASLKGKVIVLDFWATWCQPCIRSFPGMQKAVTKYQDDPDVVFLFIDTWERGDDYIQKVTDFIAKHQYTFNVLLDDGKTEEDLAPKFGVKGIPAKFVIDKKGKIIFELTGSSPYPDYIVTELTQMIEWGKKS